MAISETGDFSYLVCFVCCSFGFVMNDNFAFQEEKEAWEE